MFARAQEILVITRSRALATDRDNTRALGGERFLIPIPVPAKDGEAVVVQHAASSRGKV